MTGEAPLLDTSQSSLGGNIDSSQMSELPVQGREWTSLALLAPGNRTTAMGSGQPVQDRNDGETRDFQLNMDGQQITPNPGTGNQPATARIRLPSSSSSRIGSTRRRVDWPACR